MDPQQVFHVQEDIVDDTVYILQEENVAESEKQLVYVQEDIVNDNVQILQEEKANNNWFTYIKIS